MLWGHKQEACLCELPLGKDVVVPLPDPLDCHGCRKKTICDAEDGEDDNKNDKQSKAGFHGSWEAIQNAPSVTAVAAPGNARVTVIEG